MKKILLIISFILCHTSAYANSIKLDDLRANIPQVKFDKKQMQYLGVEEYAQKNYVKRPVGEVNTFLGDYVTSFKISLPKSYHFLSELNFEYNSSRIQNIGFGIGFSLVLPKIIVKRDSLRIIGMTSGDLIQIEEKNELANSRVEQVLNRLQLTDAKVTKYLSNNGNDNSVYLKLETSNLIHYIQLRPNNETYIFSEKGFILNAYNQNKKGIHFKYIEDILVEGFDYESEYSFEIKYQFSSTDLVFRNNKFLPKVLGIDHLILKQGDALKLFKFLYEEEYLKQVYVAGSKYNIFAAKYSDLETGSFGVKQVPAVYHPKTNSVLSYFSNKLDSKPEFKILSNDEYSYLIDVNNDMVLDKVVVNLKSKVDRANDILKKLNYIKTEGNFYKINRNLLDLENEINDFQERVDVYLGQIDDSGEIVFKKDETMSGIILPSKLLKLELVDKKEKYGQTVGSGENQYEIEYYVQSIDIKMNYLKSLKFIDIDNNGLKDIFLCNNNQIISDSNLKLVGKYKDFQQNLISKYYYNLLLNKTDSSLSEMDKADHIIYFFNDVKKIIAQGKRSDEKESLKNELLNASYFEVSRLTNAVTCNQTSIILDANNDGQLDLLTGNILTLLGNDGSSLNKELTSDELGKYFEYPSSDLKILEYPVELVDSNNNNKFSFVEGFGTIIDRMDRSLIVTRPDSELRYYRPTPIKHLVKEFSKFSGTVELKYRYHLGSALVVEKILNNSVSNIDSETDVSLTNGKKVKSVYSYLGSKIDERTNILLGHSSVLINSFSENLRGELVPSGFTKTTFLRDMSTHSHFYLLKAKRLGQIQRVENYSNESKLLSYTNYSYKEYPLSLNNRSLSLLSAKESYLIGNSSGAIVERYSLRNPINGFVYQESETRKPKNKKIFINKFNPLTLGLCLEYEGHFSIGNDEKLTPDVQYTCDKNGLIVSKKVEDNEIEFKYDYLERLVSTRDSNGRVEAFDYYNNSPLIKKAIVDEKEQVFDYEFISNRLIKFQENKGIVYRYTWSHGDDLETILSNETILLKQKFSKNKVSLFLADEVFEITLDGFGELLKQVKVLSNNEEILQKYHIVNADGRILRKEVLNDINKDIVSTDFVYDELGRLLSEVERGGYAKNYYRALNNIYNEGELTSIEMLDGRNKSQFNRSTKKKFNNYSEVVSVASGSDGNDSEVVNFEYNDNGKLVRAKEDFSGLDSVYGYDLMGRISTSKADDIYSWKDLHSEYLNNGRLNISTVGTKKLDAYDRVVINENNSKRSHFLEDSTFSVGNLVDT
ncbi:MAG: hypothetical protein L6Q33_04560, partial [Bacteriovoracaceae bacterium]|nr:hypothetical protein [Bacteriovoracaceae bacterium]